MTGLTTQMSEEAKFDIGLSGMHCHSFSKVSCLVMKVNAALGSLNFVSNHYSSQ